MVEVDSFTKIYSSNKLKDKHSKGFLAVDSVSFTARPGLVTGLLGPNGAGKTTILKARLAISLSVQYKYVSYSPVSVLCIKYQGTQAFVPLGKSLVPVLIISKFSIGKAFK